MRAGLFGVRPCFCIWKLAPSRRGSIEIGITNNILDRERREVIVDIATSPILDANSGNTTGVVTILHKIPDMCELL
jgi:hypothetical protein